MKTLQEERYLFRQSKQKIGEPIDAFYERLKQEIKRCRFKQGDEEERLKEQIIDKCTSVKLREIALQVDMSLEQLVFTGKTVESDDKTRKEEPSKYHTQRNFTHREQRNDCSRCGFNDHTQYDQNCPALKGRCKACNKRGHFEIKCWNVNFPISSRSRSRSAGDKSKKYNFEHNSCSRDQREPFTCQPNEQKHEVKEEPNNDDRAKSQDTVENMSQEPVKCETSSTTKPLQTVYDCQIGGMSTKLVVKSHYPTNVMSKDQFKKLYTGKYKFFTTDFVPSKVGEFTFSGQFTSKIEINKETQYISFYVQEGSEDFVIIGKKMADQLKLLKS